MPSPDRQSGPWTEAVARLRKSDRTLGALIRQVGPCALRPTPLRSPYESLVQAVVYQQLNGTAAKTILNRFKRLFPRRRFPSPAQVAEAPEDLLRQAGLSRAKTAAIKDIAAKRLSGVIPSAAAIARLSDQEILDRLTTIRGVGPWTVEMLLIFSLGRSDVLPATDYGVQKGFAKVYGWKTLPKPKELLAFGERWRPHRTVAAWYFWRALDLEPRQKAAR